MNPKHRARISVRGALAALAVTLAACAALTGCGGSDGQPQAAPSTTSPPVGTSGTPTPTPSYDQDKVDADTSAAVRVPAPAFDAPATPAAQLTTGAFMPAQAQDAYKAALKAFGAYRQDPTLSQPIARTQASFTALYPTMTSRLQGIVDGLLADYLPSTFNAARVSGAKAAAASEQLNSLFYLPVPEASTAKDVREPATSAGGGYDPTAGAFGQASLTGVRIADSRQDGSLSVIVSGALIMRYNTLDENNQPKTFEIITKNASLIMKFQGGKWLVDGWSSQDVSTNLVDRT